MAALIRANSPSLMIRDGFLSRVKLSPFFYNVTRFGKSIANVLQEAHLPYLGCYLVGEQFGPDGTANHAEPRFEFKLNLGFSYIIQNNDAEAAEDILDAGYWALMGLFYNPKWHTFPSGVGVESVDGGQRSHHFGNLGSNQNELPIAEMRMELNFTHRYGFPPIVTDDFDGMRVTTNYPWPYDPEERITVESVYDVNENT